MQKSAKIYIAGHTGMVGSAIVRRLISEGYSNLVLRTHKELNILDQSSTRSFFEHTRPDYIFICAAKVGGIKANDTYRGQFLYENLTIQNNLIHSAHMVNVKKLVFLGSACIYPRLALQPIKEEYLLTGELEPTNEPYAISKIAGIKLCENYFLQYGSNFISVMPNNLYGINDNFELETSHVLPALLRKFHDAKIQKKKTVEIWGTGKPKREFLHVNDLADACIFLMNKLNAEDLYKSDISHINVGSGEEISIDELAKCIKDIVGFSGDLIFNEKYPDGMPRKLLDDSRIRKLGWQSNISLRTGLEELYSWYRNNN